MSTHDPLYIGNSPVYLFTGGFVFYELPFTRFRISTPFGSGYINVNNIFLEIYGEKFAVPFTAWGNVREHFKRHLISHPNYCAMRDAFIARVTYQKIF